MSEDNSQNGGGRSLGGGTPEPLPTSWVRPANSQPRIGRIGGWTESSSGSSSRSHSGGPRMATLRDIGSGGGPMPLSGGGGLGGGGGGGGHPNSDDDEDEENEGKDEAESWFAGGERSGISVQNPDRAGVPGGNMVRDLLRRAAEAGPPPGALPTGPGASTGGFFTGGGHTLGSEDVESTFIPDPNAPEPIDQGEGTAIRHLTFWRDGFSVEDGELMRYDDPANDQILAEINAGRAPPQILNVLPGQPVELRVAKRLSENYTAAPKRPTAAFGGSGNRLGSPAPAIASETTSVPMPGSFPAAASSSGGSGSSSGADRPSMNTMFQVDQTLPTTSVQIRLADGTRIVARMNLTHKVQDLRNFINASRPENLTRPYTIGTTFPNRTLDDDSQTIEAAGLVNSVIVQRWA